MTNENKMSLWKLQFSMEILKTGSEKLTKKEAAEEKEKNHKINDTIMR